MELCSSGHEEIAYAPVRRNTRCPICDLLSDKDAEIKALTAATTDTSDYDLLAGQLRELQGDNKSMLAEIETLKIENENLQNQVDNPGV